MVILEDQNNSIFTGYLWEVYRIYASTNKYKVKQILYFDSSSNKIINNDYSTIMISEPIINVNDEIRNHVLSRLDKETFYLLYENDQWKLEK